MCWGTTQGTGLSLHHGHHPKVTSRETTVSGCLAETGIAPSWVRKTIMVVRRYPIRVHGKEAGPVLFQNSAQAERLTYERIS